MFRAHCRFLPVSVRNTEHLKNESYTRDVACVLVYDLRDTDDLRYELLALHCVLISIEM